MKTYEPMRSLIIKDFLPPPPDYFASGSLFTIQMNAKCRLLFSLPQSPQCVHFRSDLKARDDPSPPHPPSSHSKSINEEEDEEARERNREHMCWSVVVCRRRLRPRREIA